MLGKNSAYSVKRPLPVLPIPSISFLSPQQQNLSGPSYSNTTFFQIKEIEKLTSEKKLSKGQEIVSKTKPCVWRLWEEIEQGTRNCVENKAKCVAAVIQNWTRNKKLCRKHSHVFDACETSLNKKQLIVAKIKPCVWRLWDKIEQETRNCIENKAMCVAAVRENWTRNKKLYRKQSHVC